MTRCALPDPNKSPRCPGGAVASPLPRWPVACRGFANAPYSGVPIGLATRQGDTAYLRQRSPASETTPARLNRTGVASSFRQVLPSS